MPPSAENGKKVPEVPRDSFGHELLYFVLFGHEMLFWLQRTAGRGVRTNRRDCRSGYLPRVVTPWLIEAGWGERLLM